MAPRIERYKTDPLGGVRVAECSQALRVLIYGGASTMLFEREVQKVARNNALRAEVVEQTGTRRWVGSETYAGVEIVKAICAFARKRAST